MALVEGGEIIDNYYTGVGSRNATDEVGDHAEIIAKYLALKGWILRSGAAKGMDHAFEVGCDEVDGKKEIYIPARGFNGSDSTFYFIPAEVFEIARQIHPNWQACINQRAEENEPSFAEKAHARNVLQVMGGDLKTPSKFLVCWTPKGDDSGGTRTAIVLARQMQIPVYNIFHNETANNLVKMLMEL